MQLHAKALISVATIVPLHKKKQGLLNHYSLLFFRRVTMIETAFMMHYNPKRHSCRTNGQFCLNLHNVKWELKVHGWNPKLTMNYSPGIRQERLCYLNTNKYHSLFALFHYARNMIYGVVDISGSNVEVYISTPRK